MGPISANLYSNVWIFRALSLFNCKATLWYKIWHPEKQILLALFYFILYIVFKMIILKVEIIKDLIWRRLALLIYVNYFELFPAQDILHQAANFLFLHIF